MFDDALLQLAQRRLCGWRAQQGEVIGEIQRDPPEILA
jgi:hypothetical protein